MAFRYERTQTHMLTSRMQVKQRVKEQILNGNQLSVTKQLPVRLTFRHDPPPFVGDPDYRGSSSQVGLTIAYLVRDPKNDDVESCSTKVGIIPGHAHIRGTGGGEGEELA